MSEPVSEQTFKVFADEMYRRHDSTTLLLGSLDTRMREANGRTSKNESVIDHLRARADWRDEKDKERDKGDAERDKKIGSLQISRAQAIGVILGISALSSFMGAVSNFMLK